MSDDSIQVLYTQLWDSIAQLDKELDSTLESPSNMRKIYIGERIEAVKDTIDTTVADFIEQIKGTDIETQAGLYYGFNRALTSAFGKTMDEFVDKTVATLPKPTPLIEASEVPVKSKERSELYQSIKQIVELANKFNMGEFELPKKRTGKSGKRGPRKLTFFEWTIDENTFENLKAVVDIYPQYDKVADLTAAMRANKVVDGKEVENSGLDLSNPKSPIEFNMPDGRVLVGTLNEGNWNAAQAAPPSETEIPEDPDNDLGLDDDDEVVSEEAEAL